MNSDQIGVSIPVSIGSLLGPKPDRFRLLSCDGYHFVYFSTTQEIFGIETSVVDEVEKDFAAIAGELAATRDFESPSSLTKYAEIKNVVIHPSQRCNLNCVYCYANDLNKANSVMSFEVADRVVSKTLALTSSGLSTVKFLGGEPTLAWPVVERLAEGYLSGSAALRMSPPMLVMVTNGTRVNDRIVNFCRDHEFFVWVSLDGPADVHDVLRPSRGGGGTYLNAARSIKDLIGNRVTVGVEAVYTDFHLSKGISPQEIIEHFRSLGIRFIHLTPAYGNSHGYDITDQIEEVGELFTEAVRSSVRSLRTDDPFLIRGIESVIRGFIEKSAKPFICGAGRTVMAINYDGEAFPCYLLESPSTSYGYVDQEWDEGRCNQIRDIFEINQKVNHVECRECWNFEMCQSCLGASFMNDKHVTKPETWQCMLQKNMTEAALSEIAGASVSPEWDKFLSNLSSLYSDRGRNLQNLDRALNRQKGASICV